MLVGILPLKVQIRKPDNGSLKKFSQLKDPFKMPHPRSFYQTILLLNFAGTCISFSARWGPPKWAPLRTTSEDFGDVITADLESFWRGVRVSPLVVANGFTPEIK